MGNLIEWQAPNSETSWTHARVYRGTTRDTALMTQIIQQLISDTTYYDPSGTIDHYYAVTFYDGTYESDYSRIVKQVDVTPTYSTVQLVRRQMSVTSTTVLSDEAIEKWILFSEAEVEGLTGRTFKYPSGFTDYISTTGKRTPANSPIYETADSGEYDPYRVMLKNYPVQDVKGAWRINKRQAADYVFSDDGGSFTTQTTEAATQTGTPFYAFAATPAANDALYIGNSARFLGVNVRLATAATASIVIWEYYNGSTWVELPDVSDETEHLELNGQVMWGMPLDWTATTVNSVASQYWIRCRVTTAPSVSPKIQYVYLLDEIGTEYDLMDIEFERDGEVTFLTNILGSGERSIRIDYTAGETSVPMMIQDLTTVLASIKGFIAISGGSYDDMSNYRLGELEVSLGEPYVNIREAITQLEKRRDELVKNVGKRIVLEGSGGHR